MATTDNTPFRPGVIVQRLREIQAHEGFLPDHELELLARELQVPLYRIQEVASFFPHFRLNSPPSKIEVHICRDMACHLAGSGEERFKELERKFHERGVHISGASCLGRCDRAPVMLMTRHDPEDPLEEEVFGRHFDFSHSTDAAWEYITSCIDQLSKDDSSGKITPDKDEFYPIHNNRPWDIDCYSKDNTENSYQTAREFLEKFPTPILPALPGAVVARLSEDQIQKIHPKLYELQLATLLGMGGAGAPAFRKWLDVWESNEGEKYIVCNGDESEPGTFKDRELLLKHPHLVVEGVILAGLMLNAKAGYIFIRHEYLEPIAKVRAAIRAAEDVGVCGEKLRVATNNNRRFTVEAFVSPGGYICGEQGALLEAMSDRRGQPRNRPPEPQANGLNEKPTVVNNVETLSWVPSIVKNGGHWYAGLGYKTDDQTTSLYKGKRLFSISGDVKKPGVYEVPIGMPLKNLIENLAGGIVHPGAEIYAVASSGPSAGFLPRKLPHQLDSINKEITKLKTDLEFRHTIISWCTQLLSEWESLADSPTKQEKIDPFFSFLLDCNTTQFDDWKNMYGNYPLPEKPISFATIDQPPSFLKLKVGSTKGFQNVVPFDIDQKTGIASPTKGARAKPSLRDRYRRKKSEWDTRIDLDSRILLTLETLRANDFKVEYLPLDLNVFRNLPRPLRTDIDILLGAGIVIYDTTRKGKLLQEAINLSEFFANESCGKCVPCRIGSDKLVALGKKLTAKEIDAKETKIQVEDLSQAMKQTSICSLGTSAPNGLYSIYRSFPEELPS